MPQARDLSQNETLLNPDLYVSFKCSRTELDIFGYIIDYAYIIEIYIYIYSKQNKINNLQNMFRRDIRKGECNERIEEFVSNFFSKGQT